MHFTIRKPGLFGRPKEYSLTLDLTEPPPAPDPYFGIKPGVEFEELEPGQDLKLVADALIVLSACHDALVAVNRPAIISVLVLDEAEKLQAAVLALAEFELNHEILLAECGDKP